MQGLATCDIFSFRDDRKNHSVNIHKFFFQIMSFYVFVKIKNETLKFHLKFYEKIRISL